MEVPYSELAAGVTVIPVTELRTPESGVLRADRNFLTSPEDFAKWEEQLRGARDDPEYLKAQLGARLKNPDGTMRPDFAAIMHAVGFSELAHQGQTRANGAPYVVHPLRIVLDYLDDHPDADTDILITLIGHDWFEDTEVSRADVQHEFGPAVAVNIAYLSSRVCAEEVELSDEVYYQLLQEAPVEVQDGKVYDRLDNLEGWTGADPSDRPPERRAEKIEHTIKYIAGFAEHDHRLEQRLLDVFIRIKAACEHTKVEERIETAISDYIERRFPEYRDIYKPYPVYLPDNLTDQLANTPLSVEKRVRIAAQLGTDLVALLTKNQIPIFAFGSRAKTDEGIGEKIDRIPEPHKSRPLPDIYGARFVVPETCIGKAVALVEQHYSVPEKYPWGLSGVINHGIMSVSQKARYSFSLPGYRAIHVHVPFGEGRLGQVQLFTPDQAVTANGNRAAYVQNRDSKSRTDLPPKRPDSKSGTAAVKT